MFLDIDDDGNVFMRKGALNIQSVKDLYSSDKRSESKPFFHKCITIIYHLHKREHEFSNLGEKERQTKVAHIYCPEEDIKKYLDNARVQAVIEDYKTLEYTPVQRLYEGIKRSLEHWKLYMSKIPMERKVKYEAWHDVVIEVDGKPETRSVQVRTMIEIDNSEEYLKAMKRADEMIDMEDKMFKKMIRETQVNKVNEESTMLEKGEFDHMLVKKTIK